ncbi:MAG: Holliday junction branch migration protein RuvA [Rhodospirillales bacterium]|nr:Holliday junction branch migration protein RuvA [Rhodospirillales bacterium]
MIAKLRGVVDSTGADWAVIDVGGVGYLVSCSSRSLGRLTQGQSAALHVETQVREDSITLYGFMESAEREWFRLLTTVQGVGSKVALAVLSALTPDQLIQAISAQDKAELVRANGVGPRLAARIISELKDKCVAMLPAPVAVSAHSAAGMTPASGGDESGAVADAISALVNLGYRRIEAYGAVMNAARPLGEDVGVQALIRASLKELARELER